MQAQIAQTPEQVRFNNLCPGETLDRFAWFEILPCRVDQTEECVLQCEAQEAEFWSIYGRFNEGTDDAPEYLAYAVHDEFSVMEIVRIARQIAIETGKDFVAGDARLGQFPKRIGIGIWPVNEFTEIAEDLTVAIHEDIERTIPEEDRRVDDFDNHPLADLREAFVDFSDYSGSGQRDPYQPLDHSDRPVEGGHQS
ncbi:hypothetical protein [Ruegeria sp. HKCCD8929]|uniref:hypothetical protein n=1 Tax=Ruegeria sp. HKCCD8929 TaxID=2683006 RepID=UPI001487D8A6|nr:hypothetical protein [Ruegeria sp. HKCCD8929]